MYNLPSSLSRVVTRPQETGLNIGLHTQTLERPDGIVAGSEITTFGLMRAFEKRNDVNMVTRYGLGNYKKLDSDDLDLLIIEGWHRTLPQFIQIVRKHHPRVRIFFWNLSFLGIRDVVKLDIDGFFTNSRKMVPNLERIAPTKFIMLAADPEEFKPGNPETKYSHNVVYLGVFRPFRPPKIVERILYEAIDYGLVIYGNGWEEHPVLKRFCKGKLPVEDTAKLYRSAKIVLGMTEDCQRAASMINNRIFEALSCGACCISEYFSGLEEVFSDTVLYSRKKGDTSGHIEKLLEDSSYRRILGTKGRELILRHHTYDHRVEQILDFYHYIGGLTT